MRYLGLLLVVGFAAGTAIPAQERIVGGQDASISRWPHMVAMLYSTNLIHFFHFCGGSIINQRSVLTAAHCIIGDVTKNVRFRAGSERAHSGGDVYTVGSYAIHPDYYVANYLTYINDIAIVRAEQLITFIPGSVGAAALGSTNYYLGDNEPVWATGWGRLVYDQAGTEFLQEVEIFTVNLEECRRRFATIGRIVTDGMVCAGLLDVGGKDQCYGDSGGPVHHHGVVVALTSWGEKCAEPFFPGVNARVSNFFTWINANA